MKKKKRTVSSNIPLRSRIWKSRQYYLLILPAVIYVLIFCYAPMYGLQIAFKDYKVSLGILGSRWVGFRNFTDFFNGYYFWNLIRNTFALSLYTLFVGFPVPILVALVVNELSGGFKRVTQTVLYAPHFISTVVIVGMITILFSPSMGVVNTILNALGMDSVYFLGDPKYFRHLYVWSGVWQDMGWGAIIYIAALSGIDPCLHEAASIDGASRLQRILHINIPGILPTIIIMLILQIGNIASVGYEKVYLLQNDLDFSDYAWTVGQSGFVGLLNGQGYTVKGITSTATKDGDANVFSSLKGGTIMNITFEDIRITNSGTKVGIIAEAYGGYLYNIKLKNIITC